MMYYDGLWWRKYRKRIYKPNARNMSFEMVLRRITKKTLKEYTTHCSINGVSSLFDPKISFKER